MIVIQHGRRTGAPVTFRSLFSRRARKPRIRINQNDWIRHDSGPFPFDPRTPVEVIFLGRDHVSDVEYAKQWPDSWWSNTADDWRWNIRWYRIVADPVPPARGRA